MSLIVSHSKCQKCRRVLNVAELKENAEGIGKVCIDEFQCKQTQEKSNQAKI